MDGTFGPHPPLPAIPGATPRPGAEIPMSTRKKPTSKSKTTKTTGSVKATHSKATGSKAGSKGAKKAAKKATPAAKKVAPTTPDSMSAEVIEFITAIDDYKRTHQRPFPNWSEVLDIVKALGYARD